MYDSSAAPHTVAHTASPHAPLSLVLQSRHFCEGKRTGAGGFLELVSPVAAQ